MPTPFYEDFFERIVDVKWSDEPEVYWMIGTGYCRVINARAGGGGVVFTSDDGIRWTESGSDLSPIFTGCWMREGLLEAARPIWVFAGSKDPESGPISAVISSSNGTSFDGEAQLLDLRHDCERLLKSQQEIESVEIINGVPRKTTKNTPCIRLTSRFCVPGYYDHTDSFTSGDGASWSPDHYHYFDPTGYLPGIGVGPAMASGPSITPMQSPTGSIIEYISIFLIRGGPRAMTAGPAPRAMNAPSLLADSPAAQDIADRKVFKASGISATGKLRKGKLAGKSVTMTIAPWHSPPDGGDHGDTTLVITDAKTGRRVGVTDCGVGRTITIGYGHYVFVVGGSSDIGHKAGAEDSTIAYTEDGQDWKVIELGKFFQVTTIVVGPRK